MSHSFVPPIDVELGLEGRGTDNSTLFRHVPMMTRLVPPCLLSTRTSPLIDERDFVTAGVDWWYQNHLVSPFTVLYTNFCSLIPSKPNSLSDLLSESQLFESLIRCRGEFVCLWNKTPSKKVPYPGGTCFSVFVRNNFSLAHTDNTDQSPSQDGGGSAGQEICCLLWNSEGTLHEIASLDPVLSQPSSLVVH
jgi:hypothetical protein